MKVKFLTASSLLIATLTLATLINPAHAETTSSTDNHQQTTQSQQQKTPKIDKGNSVKPVEKKERANVILPNNDRHQINDTTLGHYAPVTFVQVQSNEGTFIASGVVVGKNKLLTNKHVVDATHGNPRALKAFPSAVNQNNYPNGGFTGEQITKYPGNADLAIVKFSPNDKNQNIGEVVTPATLSDNSDTNQNQPITVTGYPGDKPLATMWESRGKITQIQGEDMHYDLSTTGGNSGSPVFNSRNEVIGIHWGGAANSYNGAVFINKDVQNFLKQNIEDIHFSNSDNNDDNDNNNDTNDKNGNNNDDDNNYDNPDAA
ncbi:trypsin-like serine peptidase [Staphylococcus warneri]|uniref:trypsin-like serine peptidase n=1 Tax=Staphylococcus warneri TaxID=1292 RepID=UPI00066D4608|nr:serine protease [Staphylococcus warneri]RQM98922.1 serine protease [Staphylococcus warneri]